MYNTIKIGAVIIDSTRFNITDVMLYKFICNKAK